MADTTPMLFVRSSISLCRYCSEHARIVWLTGDFSASSDSINSTIVKSLWGSPLVDWAVLDAIHTAGGILLAWGLKGV